MRGHLSNSSLPAKMYESNFELDENGNPMPIRRIKDRDEKAEKTYPFLIVKRKERINEDREM